MIALIVLGALAAYIALGVWIVRKQKTRTAKYIALAVLVLIPTWDEIVGRVYFYYLCETEGGSKIYQSVELSKEHFNKWGKPDFKIRRRPGVFLELADRYVTSRSGQDVSKTFRIMKTTIAVRDAAQNVELATNTSFVFFGGWVLNSMGQVRGTRCPQGTDGYYDQFYGSIFKPAKTNN